MIACSKCDNKNSENNIFCDSCGAKLTNWSSLISKYKWIFVGLGFIILIVLLFFVFTKYAQKTKYVCPDGITVSDKSLCPKKEEKKEVVNEVSDKGSDKTYPTVVCNKPYISYGASCCLDQNNNNICDSDEAKLDEVHGAVSRTPFIGGTSGITINFEEDSPPPQITDESSSAFNVIIRLKNDGEYKVEKNDIKVNLIGFDPNDFGRSIEDLRDTLPDDDLEAKKRDAEGSIIEGTTTFVTFPKRGKNFIPTKFSGNTEFTFRADVCYNYETEANTILCILKDMVNVRDDSICKPTSTKTVYSSAAPVQVTNFKQSVVDKDRLNFSFDVVLSENVDLFWSKDSKTPASGFEQACPRDPSKRRAVENKVGVEITGIQSDPTVTDLSCGDLEGSSQGVIKLVSDRTTIDCAVTLVQDRLELEKTIGIHLTYNILDNKETRVLVKHLAVG